MLVFSLLFPPVNFLDLFIVWHGQPLSRNDANWKDFHNRFSYTLSSLAAPVQISESLKHNLHISLSFFFLPVQNILFMVQLTTIKFQ